ncbi:hypothetical protein LY76DRAFT_353072 [Colletotrichum caudatum]|nr:hypothetical protein LY76DRAFT_353072 [Colletotrichum caudatum]
MPACPVSNSNGTARLEGAKPRARALDIESCLPPPLTISHISLCVPDASLSVHIGNLHRPDLDVFVPKPQTRLAGQPRKQQLRVDQIRRCHSSFVPSQDFVFQMAGTTTRLPLVPWSTSTSSVENPRCAGDTDGSVRSLRIQNDGRRLQTGSLPCPCSRHHAYNGPRITRSQGQGGR